ncbi:MAG: carboxypeptidase regulatory-like domain-containing protein [Candidatus Solibacter sp.]
MRIGAILLAICGVAHGYQSAPAKGSIVGQVMNGKAGSPLKKATVTLAGVNSGIFAAGAAGRGQMPLRKAVETDETGRFSFSGLEPGKYQLSAERQGFLRQSYGARRYQGSGTPVLVGDGQNVTGIVFSMTPQAVITGKVLDEDGEGVANAPVRAWRYVYRSGKRQWASVGAAQTSDIGEFRLPNLEPGQYLVSATARMIGVNVRLPQSEEPLPATPDLVYASTYYPSSTTSATAVPVDVGPGGEVRGIDVRLVKTRVFRVRGRVVGAGDVRRPPTVTLMPREGAPGTPANANASGTGGEFELRNVPPGQYTAIASLRAPGGAEFVAMQPVDVVGNHVDGVVLTLASGGEVKGSVKVEDSSSPVELKNLSVTLRPVGFAIAAPLRAKVGDDLKFTLPSVPPVPYEVIVSGVPETCYVKSIKYGGSEIGEDGIAMTNGSTLEVTLSAAAARIDTVVLTKDGKAAGRAVVALLPKDGGPTVVQTADENGMISFRGLKPGEYQLIAWDDVESGAPFDPDFVKPYEAQAKSLKLDASGHEAVQLRSIGADQ